MADVILQQPIRSVYKDGSIVVSNVKSKIDNSTTSYSVVTSWYDGSAMDDSKVDQWGVYSKYKATGEYLRENKPQWGELFLEVNTVSELRAMSRYNQFLIIVGYYKGVRLSGYYEKGDTPGAIDYFLSNTDDSDDAGSIFEVGIVKLEHLFIGSVNWLYFGASTRIENNVDTLNKVVAYAMVQNLDVFLGSYKNASTFKIDFSNKSILINKSISIYSDSNTFLKLSGGAVTKTLFSISDNIDITSVISIRDINTVGVSRCRLIGKEVNGITTFPKIQSLSLSNLKLGSHSIAINFHCDRLSLINIKGGIGITDNTNSSFYLSISPDVPAGIVNSSMFIDNVHGYGGTEDLDMFFIKGYNYKSISITNCLAEWLAFIPSKQGDGFDLDGVGEKAFLSNLRAINCGIEIKYSAAISIRTNYNLCGSNLIATRGSISLRCGGTFTNIISEKPVTTGLIIAGYSGSEDINNSYLNIVNASVLFDSNGPVSAAPVTLAIPNTTINGLNIIPHVDDVNARAPAGLRISTVNNIKINGLFIKNCPQIVTTPAGQNLSNITIRDVKAVNISDRGFDFGENSTVSNSLLENVSLDNYGGSYNNLFQLRDTQVYSNIRINNFPYTWYGVLLNLSTFKTHCANFIIDNSGWDTTDIDGYPMTSNVWPVGILIKKRIGLDLYLKISGSSNPATAYKRVTTINATPSVKGVVNQAVIQSNSSAADIQEIVSDFNSLLTKLRMAGIISNI